MTSATHSGPARVGQVLEVGIGRRRAPEDLLGHPQDVDRGQEGAEHAGKQPPRMPRLPGAEEGEELGDEARGGAAGPSEERPPMVKAVAMPGIIWPKPLILKMARECAFS